MRTLESAKWWKRLLAIVYDTLIVAGLLMIAGFAVLALNGVHAVPPNTYASTLSGCHRLGLLRDLLVARWKDRRARAWKLEVRDLAGNYPSLGRASLRAVLALLSVGLAGVGLLWCLIDPQGQSAHDRLSGTQLLQEVR